jgi:hypothetical protein
MPISGRRTHLCSSTGLTLGGSKAAKIRSSAGWVGQRHSQLAPSKVPTKPAQARPPADEPGPVGGGGGGGGAGGAGGGGGGGGPSRARLVRRGASLGGLCWDLAGGQLGMPLAHPPSR